MYFEKTNMSGFTWLPITDQSNQFLLLYDFCNVLQKLIFFTGLLLNGYFFYRVSKASCIHVNFRIVLFCAAISFQIMTTTHFILHIILENIRYLENRLLINLVNLFICHLHMVAIFSSALCMNMIAVEQQLATFFVENYEKRSGVIGVILMSIVFFQSVPTGVIYQYVVMGDDFKLDSTYNSCILTDLYPQVGLHGFSVALITCTGSALWLLILRSVNKKRTRNRLNLESLSARFQQTMNSDSNASIAPSMIGYTVMALLGLIVEGARIYFINDFGSILDRAFIKLTFIILDSYAICHALCFLLCNSATRQQVVRDIARIFGGGKEKNYGQVRSREEDYQLATDTYFSQLKNAWDVKWDVKK
ncbi:unnamed protein product [Bursaphelenchus okinawaensis]|uniref:G_PROTEIN_RECEP_F1_2 domain-containing protein n=1 Tax=Bursaphelenchus okinawaensis TaxID=465554 RepID=A0A811KN67_9BILA|nr:unnamed protein product [Bursaphelenchus okinawaensis]CAG9108155.1 unnamed protein product [Bursaphelenchus okinawaensis]